MAKPKMQYFEISNGVRRDIDEETLTYSKFGSYVSTNYGKDVDTDLTLPVDPNEYAFLKTNPFLITWNRSNENYKSYTLMNLSLDIKIKIIEWVNLSIQKRLDMVPRKEY